VFSKTGNVILHPLERQQHPREVMFIIDANTNLLEVCTEGGWSVRRSGSASERLLFDQEECAVYSLVPPKQLVMFQGHHNWKVMKYHGRVQRLIYKDSVSIYSWATFGPDPQQLLPLFDAFSELGVNPTSLSTMARNSWLRTLPRKLWLKEWSSEDIGKAAFIGGRKEAAAAPANYVGAKYLDLPAAYLQAMAAPVPTHIRETEPRWCDSGFAQATIEILPGLAWNPLPIRLGTGKRGTDFQVYGWGKGHGIWEINELRNAVDEFGAKVELQRVWRGYRESELFSSWLPWAHDLRGLSDAAGIAAKALTTRLWSLFAMNGTRHGREVLSFADKEGKEKVRTPIPMSFQRGQIPFVSAIVSSRVRVRLLNELLGEGAVYCDTDGGIVPDTVDVAGWKTDRVMDRVEIKAAQAFRWYCPGCAENHIPWHYSIAGFPQDSPYREQLFEYANASQTWDIGPYSMTLPAGEIREVRSRFQTSTATEAPYEEDSL